MNAADSRCPIGTCTHKGADRIVAGDQQAPFIKRGGGRIGKQDCQNDIGDVGTRQAV